MSNQRPRDILAVDIGNTTISFGVIRRGRLLFTSRMETGKKAQSQGRIVHKACKKYHIDKIVVSSVVPEKNTWMKRVSRKYFSKTPHFLDALAVKKMGIRIAYRPVSSVGADRLALALACFSMKLPLVIIDFGTALTFDVLSDKKEYLGGIIFPGPALAFRALGEKASLLKGIAPLRDPKKILGSSTPESLGSGKQCGYLSLVEGVIRRLEKHLRHPCTVVFTGVDSKSVYRDYKHPRKHYNQFLVLKGLSFWAQNLT